MFGPNKKRGFLIPVMFVAALLWGCSGSDGSAGPQGPQGPQGPEGPPAPVPDAVTAAIDSAQPESCSTCHGGVGDDHQAIYDKYVDGSTLALTFDTLTSTPSGGNFIVTLTFTITKNGAPFIDVATLSSLDEVRFEAISYDSATGLYLTECRLNENYVALGGGQYSVQDTNCPYAPNQRTVGTQGAHVYGYIADTPLFTHEGDTSEIAADSHVHLYDNVASAALAYGTAITANESVANVEGCEKCHGTPYLKHGFRDPIVAGLPNFASCKSCHYDDRNGSAGKAWQQMVDAPLDWANGVATPPEYAYIANLKNDVHMSHAMEFPYPQSMSNCATCHGPVNDENGVLIPGSDKLAQVLDNSNFTLETCRSCHPVTGTDAWPEALAGQDTTYNQPHRAPPLEYLWLKANNATFHNTGLDCQSCHGDPAVPTALPFDQLHSGYDIRISDASGQKYGDQYTVSIDQVTLNGDLLTVNFTANNPAIVPEVLVSLYGWDSKNYIVASHSSDGSTNCLDRRGNPGGCRMEYAPESSGGSANPLFTEDAASVPGDWMVTLDLGAYVPTAFLTDDIPTLIANGKVKMAEITITPELEVGGEDVVLHAVGASFDLGGSMVVDDYFKGDNATVDTAKCDVCHDSLASSFHDGSGRGGGGIQVCKNCHVTTSPGSHLEMASRAIDSYVHAIHSFQPFDLGSELAKNDPVIDKRIEEHKLHTFPNFTIRNCESCHKDGTYNVPDQSKSMPGVLSKSWSIADRNIGTVPEYVTGPASRACGGCHRADLINADLAGDLAAFNAHTKAFGTLVSNEVDDPADDDQILYGIIDKIMSLFE
jgi:OmcA/MtrC family decaheme c-type cytochrome